MLYIDLPTHAEIAGLFKARGDACVSIYLKTTPVSRETQASRIELGNLAREAQQQLEAAGFDKRRLAPLIEHLEDLRDDSAFWSHQAHSLAIFATPERVQTFRLANQLHSMVQVADRFHLKPLLRSVTFPHVAYILALSENAVRLVEIGADLPATTVHVPDLPKDAASAVGKSTLNDRSPSGRLQGREGQNVRYAQYVRQVDAAIRPILAGSDVPLILAAAERLSSVFPQLNSYPNLLPEAIAGNPDRATDAELAEQARPILDKAYEKELQALHGLYETRAGEHRTSTDIVDVARAATAGAVQTLLVDIDASIPGFVDEATGEVTFADKDDARAYDVVDEIAARAFATGARILGIRRNNIPGHGDLAAILRQPL